MPFPRRRVVGVAWAHPKWFAYESREKNKKARILAESGPLEREMEERLHVFRSRMPARIAARKDGHGHWVAQAVLEGGAVGHEGLLNGVEQKKRCAFFEAVNSRQ